MNRMTRYALALALGLSAISTAAFAADPSTSTQTANAQYASPQMPGAQQTPGPYDSPFQYLGAF
ncbi:MAG: hypothetical protein ABSG66_01310 [Stellaceae bacterium]